jgi:HrpA-like RNA helicase
LRYVIDTGWVKSKEFNPDFGLDLLIVKPVTQSMARQRKGRTGRIAPGFFYPLYTEKTFNAMQENQFPEIIKDEFTLTLLSLIIREADTENLNSNFSVAELASNATWIEKISNMPIDVSKLDLLDFPSASSIYYSLEKLFMLGCVTSNCTPTLVGFLVNKFRFINIENVRMILAGLAWGVSILDLVNMAAALQVGVDRLIKKEHIYQKFENERVRYLASDDFIRGVLIFDMFEQYIATIHLTETPAGYSAEQLDSAQRNNSERSAQQPSNNSRNSVHHGAAIPTQDLAIPDSAIPSGDLPILNRAANIADAPPLEEWSKEHGIDFASLNMLIEIREDILAMLFNAGINPYTNMKNSISEQIATSHVAGTNDLKECINKLKFCIFEGYKMNIAIWNADKKCYCIRRSHMPIIVNSPITDISEFDSAANPHYIIFHRAECSQLASDGVYHPEAKTISILDGFIPIDPMFDFL